MRRIFTTILASAALLGAADDYFPLATGNEWTYRNSRGGSFTVRVGEAVEAGGRRYFAVEGYGEKTLAVRRNEAGDLVRWDDGPGTEVIVTGFGAGKFSSGAGFCREEGDVRGEPARFADGGRVLMALDIRYRIIGCADAGIEQELYVANVGMVRRVTQSIVGPVTWNLVRARLGGLSFDAEAFGRVSVQLARPEVARPPVGQPLRISGSISVDVAGMAPLELDFLSAQRFNVALVSREGEHLWTWSADKLFAAVTARESWTGAREFGWELVVPEDVAARLPEGSYRVEAVITANGQRPFLAAAAPIRIGAVN